MTAPLDEVVALYIADPNFSPSDASAFWARLPENVAIALVKAAPKVAGPWLLTDHDAYFSREWVGVYEENAASFCLYREWPARMPDAEITSRMVTEDAQLRANGWLLESSAEAETAGLSVVVTELGGTNG